MLRTETFHTLFKAGTVKRKEYEMEGVSVITEGDALGHGVMIDTMSLASVKTCAETYSGGLKVKVNHGSGADAIVGRLTNFRIDGTQLRADLKLLKSHVLTPQLMEMAEDMPEAFGLSISFSGTIDDQGDDGMFVRCLEIYSCDIVDQPAANPSGLFSSVDINKKNMATQTLLEIPVDELNQLRRDSASLVSATGTITALTAENEAFKQRMSDLALKFAEKDNENAQLKMKITTLEAHAAAEPQRLNEAVQRTLAASGHPAPVPEGQPRGGAATDETWSAKLSKMSPAERTVAMRKHRAEIFAEYRAPQQQPEVTR